jgi:hypothetical protein
MAAIFQRRCDADLVSQWFSDGDWWFEPQQAVAARLATR